MATNTGNNAGTGVQTTTVQTTNTTKVEMHTIGETAYPFIRAKNVTFTASGLKPNTQYYPFFNGAYVGNYCSLKSPPTFQQGIIVTADQALKTDALGAMMGTFYLPAQTFVSGSHTFKLVDTIKSDNGTVSPDPMYGVAEAIYEANGALKQMQTTITQDMKTTIDVAQPPPPQITLNVVAPPTPPPTPITPVAVQPVVTPVNPASPAVVTPPVTTKCESWWFEYEMIGGGGGDGSGAGLHAGKGGDTNQAQAFAGAANWIVESNSVTPPTISTAIAKYVGTEKKTFTLENWVLAQYKTAASAVGVGTRNAVLKSQIEGYYNAVAAGGTVSDTNTAIGNGRANAKTVTIYQHTFSPLASAARTVAAGGGGNVAAEQNQGYGGRRIYKMEWVGPEVKDKNVDLPSLANFTPSGLNIYADSNAAAGQQLSKVTFNIRTPWTKRGSAVCPVNGKYGFQNVQAFPNLAAWYDPLAQSFTIDAAKYPDGMFVTGISVYFKTVDQSTPVKLDIREMANGYPGTRILPRASAVNPGYATMGSPNASIPTRFTFDSPIYLKPATDYCFVVTSTSLGYNAWTSRVGELDVNTGTMIETQPFLGTLFKSENNVTWIADSYEDLKFLIHKADFDTTKTGSLLFRPQYDAITNNYTSAGTQLPLSYMTTTKGSAVVSVKVPMHALYSGDKVYITGIAPTDPVEVGYNGIPASALVGEHIVSVIDQDTITFTATLSSGDGALATVNGHIIVDEVPNLLNPVAATMPPQQTYTPGVIFNNPANLAPATLNGTNPVTATQPIAATLVSSSNFTIYTNLAFNEAMIDYLGTEFPDTEIVENLYATTAQSSTGIGQAYTSPSSIELVEKKDFYSFEDSHMLATPRNEAMHSGTQGNYKSLATNLLLKSTNKDVSPLLDVDGMSLTVRSYKIDNQNGEIDDINNAYLNGEFDITTFESRYNDSTYNSEIIPGNGKADAKYKSTVNVLGTPFNDLTLYVTGNCPAPAMIDAYIRVSSDPDTHADRKWVYVPIDGVFNTEFKHSASKFTLNEWQFRPTSAHPLATGTGYFTVFDVKLVMRSTNNSIVPKIYSVRTIANVV